MSKYLSHDEEYISCSSNISCTKLARYLYNHEISGYEFLYGIPGTLGGAVFMNAGAFEKEILNNIYSIDLLDKTEDCKHFLIKIFNIHIGIQVLIPKRLLYLSSYIIPKLNLIVL